MSEASEAALWARLSRAWRIRTLKSEPVVYLADPNQHLIDAARLEGIRLGLEAAAREIVERTELASTTDGGDEWLRTDHMLADIRALDPATIAREAALDKLASEAQKQGMGYEKEDDQ